MELAARLMKIRLEKWTLGLRLCSRGQYVTLIGFTQVECDSCKAFLCSSKEGPYIANSCNGQRHCCFMNNDLLRLNR